MVLKTALDVLREHLALDPALQAALTAVTVRKVLSASLVGLVVHRAALERTGIGKAYRIAKIVPPGLSMPQKVLHQFLCVAIVRKAQGALQARGPVQTVDRAHTRIRLGLGRASYVLGALSVIREAQLPIRYVLSALRVVSLPHKAVLSVARAAVGSTKTRRVASSARLVLVGHSALFLEPSLWRLVSLVLLVPLVRRDHLGVFLNCISRHNCVRTV